MIFVEIIGNAAEHISAITIAIKSEMFIFLITVSFRQHRSIRIFKTIAHKSINLYHVL